MMAEADHNAAVARGAAIVEQARMWIGTPYLHQASRRGAGSDCLGLLRGVWRELKGSEPEVVPPYTPDWAEATGAEDLLKAARRNLIEVGSGASIVGDVLVLRMADGGVAKHVGILAMAPAGYAKLIHAYSGHGVVESALTPAWKRRVAGVFRFPA